MEIAVISLFIIFSVSMAILQICSHKRKIEEQVHSIRGEIVSIERQDIEVGPFIRVRRGNTVYKVVYKLGDEIKEGWVKFGDLYGPDWRL